MFERALLAAALVLVPSILLHPPSAWPRSGQNSSPAERARPDRNSSSKPLPRPDPGKLQLRSSAALVIDQHSREVLYAKNTGTVTPIASITKLMTAMVVLDAKLRMDEPITVTEEDVDSIKGSNSKLPVGWVLTRRDMLQLALMSSENRAASALARTYPGGKSSFVTAMNQKAQALGMSRTRFADSSGLNWENVSTADDLAKMVLSAYHYDTIREMTTAQQLQVRSLNSGRVRTFGNSNLLVWDNNWEIGLSKTGYIAEAGHCLVMQSTIQKRPLVMVLLDSVGKYSRIGDARRIRYWMEGSTPPPPSPPHRKAKVQKHRRHR